MKRRSNIMDTGGLNATGGAFKTSERKQNCREKSTVTDVLKSTSRKDGM